MTLSEIEKLAVLSLEPLMDPWLEGLNGEGKPYYRFLFHLVNKFRPQACLEIGVEDGTASAHMAAAAYRYGGFVVGVDHRRLQKDTAFIGDKFGNFRFVWGDSLSVVPTVIHVLEGRDIGLVFQDSGHHYVPSKLEWQYFQPLLDTSFVWVCDDISPAFRTDDEPKGMVEYFDELPGRKWLFDLLNPGNAVGVVMP